MAQLKDTTITGSIAVSGTANITGATQHNGDVTLYAASGDSPSLVFQRGTTSDTLNDYKIVDTGGHLTIKQSGNSGTSGYTQVAKLTNTGTLSVSTPPATDTTPSVTAWISPTDSEVKVATDATIATGDKLIVRDTSDSNKMRSSSISFDTTNTTDYLRKDGTWATPAGGGGDDVFLVTLDYDDMEEEYSIDKTFLEIDTAYAAGKKLYMILPEDNTATAYQGGLTPIPLTETFWSPDPVSSTLLGMYVFSAEYPFTSKPTGVEGTRNSICVSIDDSDTLRVGEYPIKNIEITRTEPTTLTTYYGVFTDSYGKSLLKDGGYYNGLVYKSRAGTTSTNGISALVLGNGTNSGSTGNRYGYISLYPQSGNYTNSIVSASTLTANRTLTLPNKSGTLATTDDITAAINALDATNTSY